jgi:hypothetical protein
MSSTLTQLSIQAEWLEEAREGLQSQIFDMIPSIPYDYRVPMEDSEGLLLSAAVWFASVTPHECLLKYNLMVQMGQAMSKTDPSNNDYQVLWRDIQTLSADLKWGEGVWYDVMKVDDPKRSVEQFEELVWAYKHQRVPRPIEPVRTASKILEPIFDEEVILTLSRTSSPEISQVSNPHTPSTKDSNSNKGSSENTKSPPEPPHKRKTDVEADGKFGRKKVLLEERRLANIAKAEADEIEYEKNSAKIDKHYLEGDATRKTADPIWQKMCVWNARNGAMKPLYVKKIKRAVTPVQIQRLSQRTLPPLA